MNIDCIFVGGYVDNFLKVVVIDNVYVLEIVFGYCVLIICLGFLFDGSILVLGLKDVIVILWYILSVVNFGVGSSNFDVVLVVEVVVVVRFIVIIEVIEVNVSMVEFRCWYIEGLVYVLWGYVDELICCCVNYDLDFVVFSFYLWGVLFYFIVRGWFLWCLFVDWVDMVVLFLEGIIVVFNRLLRVL